MRQASRYILGIYVVFIALSAAHGADLLVRGAKVWPVATAPVERCDVLIRDGKIAAIGPNLTAPAGARVIAADGKHVCPGFIDVRSYLGLARQESDETVGGFDTELNVAEAAYWPARDEVKRAIGSGVTTCLLAPGTANPLGGRCVLAKSGGASPSGLPDVMQITLSQNALLVNRAPTSWAGLLQRLQEMLQNARQADATGALAKAVRGETQVQFVCDGPAEARQAVALARQFSLKGSLFVARPSVRLPEALAGSDLAVALPVLLTTPLDSAQSLPEALAAKHCKVLFGSETPYNEPEDLRTCSALAVAGGLSETAALRALTLDAAEALGVAGRLGSVEVDKDADLLVLGGEPLDLQAPVEMVITDGVVVYERGGQP